jgi:FAD/FMN-containing dehydrogenase
LQSGGLVLDLALMRHCSVNVEAVEVTIGGGVKVADLNAAAGRRALTAVIGDDDAVSMAGLLLGGGYEALITRFGLVSDSLISAELVMEDGAIASCDATRNSDLFWAVKDGGGNFGVVTSMRIRLHRVGQLTLGSIAFPWGDASAVLERFSGLMPSAPEELAGAACSAFTKTQKPHRRFTQL